METENTTDIMVVWRGKQLSVKAHSNCTVKEFGQMLVQLTNVKEETMKLIVPKSSNKGSKVIAPFSDAQSSLTLNEADITQGKGIMMMGVFDSEIEEVSNSKNHSDLHIIGFEEEERRAKQRMLSRRQISLQLPKGPYTFADFRTLHLPGIELSPPPSEALKRMHMLACDPGIVAIMNKHKWQVGIMTEMAPIGYVGISPKCILGFNKNHGEEISLRLRTDDLKGFRKYESIKKTLLHELAHMVHSEHDANFFALNKQLNEEADSLDWTKSTGHVLSGRKIFNHSEYEDLYLEASEAPVGHKLGGTSATAMSARALSGAAAYQRFLSMSTVSLDDQRNILALGKEDHSQVAGLDPDDVHENDELQEVIGESYQNELMQIETGVHEGHVEHNHPVVEEPDPDDACDGDFVEPDPDDSMEHEHIGLPREPANAALDDTMATSDEVDMLDGVTQERAAKLSVGTTHNQSLNEPDLNNCDREPDPDDSIRGPDQCNSLNSADDPIDRTRPDSDNHLMSSDPDLQRIEEPVTAVLGRLKRSIEMLQAEANPAEATLVLQTLWKIIRNLIEHPNEEKYRRLRKANPQFQRNVASYKAAMELLQMIGFSEDVVSDSDRVEAYMVLKRNDPGLLWLAKSSLEACMV